MRRAVFVMLMIFAMLGTTLVGCTQAAENESGSAEESENSAVQTENTTQERTEAANGSGSEQEVSGSGESADSDHRTWKPRVPAGEHR